MNSDIKIIKSKIKNAGKGVSALKNLKKGTNLGIYKGKLLSKKQYNKLKDKSYVWEIDTPKGVIYHDGKFIKRNNILRYVNGVKSKNQKENVEAYQYNKTIRYRTSKNIKKGEELIINYGEGYWEDIDLRLKPKNNIQKAVINGLLWCEDFFKNERNFNSQAINYLTMLYGMLRKTKLTSKIKSIIESVLIRISRKLKIIIKNDIYEIFIVLAAMNKVNLEDNIKRKFINYYNKSDKNIYEGDKEFQKSIENEDFDDLSDEAIAFVFMKMARESNKNIKFPKCRLNQYKKALSKIDLESHPVSSELDYYVTHLLFIYNEYNTKKIKKNLKVIKIINKYIQKHSKRILNSKDVDLISEILDCMICINDKTWNKMWKRKYINYIIKKQNSNGQWKSPGDNNIYDKFHGNWACINALYNLF